MIAGTPYDTDHDDIKWAAYVGTYLGAAIENGLGRWDDTRTQVPLTATYPSGLQVSGHCDIVVLGHGVGDVKRYNARMAAVEYAIEHDDGQSMRALDKADVILVAPSRCGKTPTTMYLALQHGVFVANYPLLDEDLSVAADHDVGPLE